LAFMRYINSRFTYLHTVRSMLMLCFLVVTELNNKTTEKS